MDKLSPVKQAVLIFFLLLLIILGGTVTMLLPHTREILVMLAEGIGEFSRFAGLSE